MSSRSASRSRPVSRRKGTGFLGEDSGAYTIFAVIGFAMLMVIVGLVIDVGRVMNVHSQASSYADRVALAAAAELDGKSGALQRAVNAAMAIPTGNRLTLTGDNEVGIARLVFMSRLGSDPENPYTRSPVPGDEVVGEWGSGQPLPDISDPANAASRFVMVETTPERENYLFFNLAGGLMPDVAPATVAPQAVAGFEQEMCNSAPIMVCNPLGISFDASAVAGSEFDFNLHAGVGSWQNSSYGLLNINDDLNVGLPLLNTILQRLLGSSNPGTACYGDNVTSEPGLLDPLLRAAISLGLNARIGGPTSEHQITVAIVNCLDNQPDPGEPVPVEAYAQVQINNTEPLPLIGVLDARLSLGFLGPNASQPPQENLREYPVLIR